MNEARLAERQEKQRFWGGHLSQWKESGLSQSAYCREHQLNLHRFVYWKQRLARQKPSVSLVEVPVSRQKTACMFPPAPPISIVFSGRCRIEVRSGFDPASLEVVLRVVSRL